MIRRMIASAVFAGFVAGLLASLLHFAFVQRYILLGEEYESGAQTHFAAAPEVSHDFGHIHDHDTDEMPAMIRIILTALFAGLLYVAYALILVAGFGVAESFGITITAREGLLWGIAGFVSFQLAPAVGLAPELPGSFAADLGARQVWWWGTAIATGAGLALLAYGRGLATRGAAILLLAAPHLIGAPLPDGFAGTAPPEVAAMFSARVLAMALVVWATLGWLAGYFWSRPKR